MRQSRILLAVVAAATVVVPVVGVGIVANPSLDWDRRLAACASLGDQDLGVQAACARDAWLAAYQGGALPEFYLQLDRWTRKEATLAIACHDAGHEAGRRALTELDRADELVLVGGTETGACNNGFLHGVLDEVAHRQGSREVYDALVAACEVTKGRVRGGCNDGIGHSAWLVDRGEKFAIDTCLSFTDRYEQGTCAGSIVMQMYREDPFTGKGSYLDKDRPDVEIPELCERFVRLGGHDLMRLECWRQGAVPIVDAALTEARAAEDDRSLALAERDRQAVEAWRKGLQRCDSFDQFATMCRERVAEAVTWAVGDDGARKAVLCRAFPAPLDERCRRNDSRVPGSANIEG